MGKESLKGDDWYKAQGLISITVRTRRGIRDAYKRKARRTGRSVQWILRRLLERNAPKR